MEKEFNLQWRLVRSALFQLDTMEVLVSLLASGACEKYPDFNFVLGESGVTWLPYVFDRLDTEYHDRARGLNFSKIGRASCRERVEIEGGAVAGKDKR